MSVSNAPIPTQPQAHRPVPSGRPPGGMSSISAGFAFGVFFLIEFLLVSGLVLLGWFNLNETADSMKKSFRQQGKQLVLSAASAGTIAYTRNNYADLTRAYGEMVDQSGTYGEVKATYEVFMIDKSGAVVAHSDISQVTGDKGSSIDKVSDKYNTDFFHSAQLLEPMDVYVRKYPLAVDDNRAKSSYLLQGLMPADLDYAVIFSSAVYDKGKPVGSVHTVLNRRYLYEYLYAQLQRTLLVIAIGAAIGLLITILVLLIFGIRARTLRNYWEDSMRYRWENQAIRNEIHSIGKKVGEIEKRSISAPPPPMQPQQNNSTEQNKEQNKGEVLDAILIEH